MRDQSPGLILPGIDFPILLGPAKAEQHFRDGAIAFAAQAGVKCAQGQDMKSAELGGQGAEVRAWRSPVQGSPETARGMSAKPVDLSAVLDRAHTALAVAAEDEAGHQLAEDVLSAFVAVQKLLAERQTLSQRAMQASGFGALLSSILGAGVLREHPDLRERVKRAVADNEAHMAKVLSGGGQ